MIRSVLLKYGFAASDRSSKIRVPGLKVKNARKASDRPVVLADLHRLNAFVVLAKELDFQRASQRLAVYQSPLIRLIRSFERDVGAKLFDRSLPNLTLTAAGMVLFGDVEAIIAKSTKAIEYVREISRSPEIE